MTLRNYGLLTGKIVGFGPQHGGNPHYVLLVQAGAITYHVAINAHSTAPRGDSPAPLQYQVRKDFAATKLAKSISNTNTFVLRQQDPNGPSLDYIRDGLLDVKKFESIGTASRVNPLIKELSEAAAKAKKDPESYAAVFGTGYPDQDDRPQGRGHDPLRASSGFWGLDNVHMNQGTHYRIGHHANPAFKENGIHQDGAVLVFFGDRSVTGFFLKFETQETETDEFGNPLKTGVAEIDRPRGLSDKARQALLQNRPSARSLLGKPTRSAKKTKGSRAPTPTDDTPVSGTSGGEDAGSFTFADTMTIIDPNRPFAADDDSQYQNSAFVEQFAKYGTPEPVPSSRNGVYPLMKLDEIIGARAINSIKSAKQLVFHAVGDTGAPAESKYGAEESVADLMLSDFAPSVTASDRPAFFFHLGDVVYFYGEPEYYYDQFYHPYKDYPAPIFAIPGNHDGITHPNGVSSLEGFISAFCDDKPRFWKEAGGIKRTTMTQPGVFFTLDAPFASIIGLYSNCDESFGYLDDQQKLFLVSELKRLKPLREKGSVNAVLLAVHHCPMSFSVSKPASVTMRSDIDLACGQANFYPDAVFSGHAHVYQRMSRTVTIGGKTRQIPHFIAGSGGYANNPRQEVNKNDMKAQDLSDPEFRLHNFKAAFGYLTVTVAASKPPTLKVEFRSPKSNSGYTDDSCVLNLDTHDYI
jgi:uncharacterized protein YukJ